MNTDTAEREEFETTREAPRCRAWFVPIKDPDCQCFGEAVVGDYCARHANTPFVKKWPGAEKTILIVKRKSDDYIAGWKASASRMQDQLTAAIESLERIIELANNNLRQYQRGKTMQAILDEAMKALPQLQPVQTNLTECQAGRDGDCVHKNCPQEANNRANYQSRCPLIPDRLQSVKVGG